MTDPFKTIEMLARERNEMLANLTRTQERITRYVEVARCAKALLDANRAAEEDAHGIVADDTARACEDALATAVQALELGPEGAVMLTPPAPATTVRSGVAGHIGVHTGHSDCPMTKGLPSGEWFGNCTCPQPQEKR